MAYCEYTRISARSSTPEPSQHFYLSQRLRLSYWSWGDESAPPLVLIHGRRDHARAWDRVAGSLCDQYHVVALDLRGHGDSAWSAGSHYAPTEFMLDIVRLIGLLGGRAAVIAHSFGAGLTLFTAGVFPERFERLVAIEAVYPRLYADHGPGPAQLREWAHDAQSYETRQERTYATVADAAAHMRKANPRLTVSVSEHLARWGTRSVAGGVTWKFDPWLRTQHGLDVRASEVTRYWGNIACPVLHIIGGESAMDRASFQGLPIESYFRDARSVRVEGAGHWLHHERFEPTLGLLRNFLVGYEG